MDIIADSKTTTKLFNHTLVIEVLNITQSVSINKVCKEGDGEIWKVEVDGKNYGVFFTKWFPDLLNVKVNKYKSETHYSMKVELKEDICLGLINEQR